MYSCCTAAAQGLPGKGNDRRCAEVALLSQPLAHHVFFSVFRQTGMEDVALSTYFSPKYPVYTRYHSVPEYNYCSYTNVKSKRSLYRDTRYNYVPQYKEFFSTTLILNQKGPCTYGQRVNNTVPGTWCVSNAILILHSYQVVFFVPMAKTWAVDYCCRRHSYPRHAHLG